MRDLLNVRRLLGLGILTEEDYRLLCEACLYSGPCFLNLPSHIFVYEVLESYRGLPQSAGKRLRLKKLQQKVAILGGGYVSGSTQRGK